MLSSTFDLPIGVVVRSRTQMRAIVERAPEGFGADPARYRYDVVFLREPREPDRLPARVPAHDDPELEHDDHAPPDAGDVTFRPSWRSVMA